MIEKKLNGLSPTQLRAVLTGTIVLIIVTTAAIFWLFQVQLSTYAQQVNKDAAAADASANDIRNLQKLQAQLEEDEVAITRTKNIVADSRSYQYQDQIIKDLSAYAKASGVIVSGYGFGSDTATSGAAANGQTAETPVAAGLKTISVSVSLKNPVDYRAFMRFIHSIELNLTKMQLTGISISPSQENKDLVTVGPLTIQVYTR